MATFTDRVKVIIDVASDGAKSGLSKFRTDLKSAETATGKFKVAGGQAFGYVKAHAAQFAAAAGVAVVGFAAKSVNAFTESAIAAGQFADATGLSVEQASQWNSVADDLGLNAKTLQAAFLKMNKSIGDNSKYAKKYGLELKKTKDGQDDVNGTMLEAIRVIGGIQDPTERAAAAQDIFGRSYAEVAEIVLGDSAKIKEALESTSEAQVIDEDELEKARRLRESMDLLQDQLTDVQMVIGELLVPAVADFADELRDLNSFVAGTKDVIPGWAKDVYDAWDKYLNPIEYLVNKPMDALGWLGDKFQGTSEDAEDAASTLRDDYAEATIMVAEEVQNALDAHRRANVELENYTEAQGQVQEAVEDAIEAHREQEEALRDARIEARKGADDLYDLYDAESSLARAVESANDTLNDSESTLYDVRDSLVDVARRADAVAQKQVEMKGQTMDTVYGMKTWNESMLTTASTMKGPMRTEVLNHIARVNGIPADKVTEFVATIDGAGAQGVEAGLNWLARPRTATINTRVTGPGVGSGLNIRYATADGTNNSPGGTTLVGEKGPEVVDMPKGAKVYPHNSRRTKEALGNGGGNTTYNTYINVPNGMRPTDVVQEQRRYERRNGPS